MCLLTRLCVCLSSCLFGCACVCVLKRLMVFVRVFGCAFASLRGYLFVRLHVCLLV